MRPVWSEIYQFVSKSIKNGDFLGQFKKVGNFYNLFITSGGEENGLIENRNIILKNHAEWKCLTTTTTKNTIIFNSLLCPVYVKNSNKKFVLILFL